ncbi:MAG: LppX_LprAFG lipoprotein [Nocardioides marinisabuli]|uniref:LppX_LprAFG lipoprotein n=1 Tax=Nocardioides marinisabuli TaxID=419476 RepID=UPI003219D688
MRAPTLAALAASGLMALGGLSACSSDDSAPAEDAPSAEEVLAEAKTTLDETSGVQVRLATDDLPEGVEGLLGAEGVGTPSPAAFDGVITVRFAGFEPEVPVVGVDDVVYAQVPLTTGWSQIDPAEYGAPDPAALLGPEGGFSSLLTSTEEVEVGEQVRGGTDNRDVLTPYTGTISGEVAATIIPSAEGDFDASYSISDDGELRSMVLTGAFYGDGESMTYTIDFDDYGSSPQITAPE